MHLWHLRTDASQATPSLTVGLCPPHVRDAAEQGGGIPGSVGGADGKSSASAAIGDPNRPAPCRGPPPAPGGMVTAVNSECMTVADDASGRRTV